MGNGGNWSDNWKVSCYPPPFFQEVIERRRRSPITSQKLHYVAEDEEAGDQEQMNLVDGALRRVLVAEVTEQRPQTQQAQQPRVRQNHPALAVIQNRRRTESPRRHVLQKVTNLSTHRKRFPTFSPATPTKMVLQENSKGLSRTVQRF